MYQNLQHARLFCSTWMTFESNQKWTEHIYGSGGLLSSLNQRLFFIRRLKNHVGLQALLKISDSLFTSKIRYGLHLLGSVRWLDSDPTNQDLQALQKCQNKLLRVLNGSKISDKVSTKSMLLKLKIKSVNQINAQIKLNEMWKSVNIVNYQIKTNVLARIEDVAQSRAVTNCQLKEAPITNASQISFIHRQSPMFSLVTKNIF